MAKVAADDPDGDAIHGPNSRTVRAIQRTNGIATETARFLAGDWSEQWNADPAKAGVGAKRLFDLRDQLDETEPGQVRPFLRSVRSHLSGDALAAFDRQVLGREGAFDGVPDGSLKPGLQEFLDDVEIDKDTPWKKETLAHGWASGSSAGAKQRYDDLIAKAPASEWGVEKPTRDGGFVRTHLPSGVTVTYRPTSGAKVRGQSGAPTVDINFGGHIVKVRHHKD